MANRRHYVNPISMGLLGGLGAGLKELDKFNYLAAQNQARLEAYKTKYGAMADVATLRARNNAMIAAMKKEFDQKQWTKTVMGEDGKPMISKGHMEADPKNPDHYVPVEDVRMTPEQYAATLGKASTLKSDEYTLAPGAKRMKGDQVIATNERPDTQSAIAARQLKVAEKKHQDAMELAKSKQERADLANKVNRVEALTDKDLKNFDGAGTPEQKLQMLKNAGVTPPTGGKDWFGLGSNDKPPTSDQIDDMRNAYEDAMRKKHAKNLGVSDKQLEEGPPAAAVDEGAPEAEGGDQMPSQMPEDHVPALFKGPDGKTYKLNPDGKTASPLAMDAVDTGEDAVAQAGPDEESGETSPDSEGAEGESDPYGGLLNQYAQQSDAMYGNAMDQMQASPDEEPAPDEEQNGLLTG